MTRPRDLVVLLALLVVVLSGCGDDGPATTTISDPPPRPSSVPAARGEVVTRTPVTVIDSGRPVLCVGGVAESYPPQCSGPALVGWDWSAHEGAFERAGDVRWGDFVVTGTWNGAELTVTRAVPADGPAVVDDVPLPPPAGDLDDEQLDGIAGDFEVIDGVVASNAFEGRVLVDVVYDDGTVQGWADATYGQHRVVVSPVLVDVG